MEDHRSLSRCFEAGMGIVILVLLLPFCVLPLLVAGIGWCALQAERLVPIKTKGRREAQRDAKEQP